MQKFAVFRDFGPIPAIFGVKAIYFTFAKNRVLKAAAYSFKTVLPRRESAPGARGKWTIGHATRTAGNGFLLLGPGA
jgi:hypothetical protein